MPIIPALFTSEDHLPEIQCSTVLLVEGDDEFRFFKSLLKCMEIQHNQDLQLRKMNGKDVRSIFEAFLNDPGFPSVTAYAVVRDADKNAGAALRSVQDLLKEHNQPCPTEHATFAFNDERTMKVGIFIMPGESERGMLEDLCLQSAADHPIMPYVEDFMKQVKATMQGRAPRNESKAKLQAFLSGMNEPVPHLGVAAQKRYWDFDHTAFTCIRRFIEQLMQLSTSKPY
jgi:hypothetical protein